VRSVFRVPSFSAAYISRHLRRNTEHFLTALAADLAALQNAKEKIVTNYDAMKRERVRLRNH
jgi:hypothetical protein